VRAGRFQILPSVIFEFFGSVNWTMLNTPAKCSSALG